MNLGVTKHICSWCWDHYKVWRAPEHFSLLLVISCLEKKCKKGKQLIFSIHRNAVLSEQEILQKNMRNELLDTYSCYPISWGNLQIMSWEVEVKSTLANTIKTIFMPNKLLLRCWTGLTAEHCELIADSWNKTTCQ